MIIRKEKNIVTNTNKKWIVILRVLSCLCVVLFHVRNSYGKDSVKIDGMNYPIYLSALANILERFHVPVFFAVSGYLYNFTKKRNCIKNWLERYRGLVIKKIVTLGIPYFTFSIAYICMNSFMKNQVNTYYGWDTVPVLYRVTVAQYWYLHSLFIMFLITPIIEIIVRDKHWIGICISIAFNVFSIVFDCGFLTNFARYYFCFWIGYYISGIPSLEEVVAKIKPYIWLILIIIGSAVFLVFNGSEYDYIADWLFTAFMIIMLLFGAISVCCRYYIPEWISKFSEYTLHIYLIHTWIIGVMRVGLRSFGVYNIWLHILFDFIGGVIISLVISIIIKKCKYLDFFIEPGRYLRL